MRTPRLAGLGLVSMATVALAVAGCDNTTTATPGTASASTPSAPAPSASASAAADPAAVSALSAATAKLGQTSFKIDVTSGSGFKLTGAIDAPHGAGTADVAATGPNAAIHVTTLLINQDLYVRIPGLTKGTTWTHVDGARLPADASIGLRPGQIDPVGTANLLGSTTDVHSTSATTFAGTLDLTKAAGVAGISKVTIDGYGPAATQVPFTATLDDQGRLSELTIKLPAAGGQPAATIDARYTDYDAPVSVQRPAAAEVTEAPDSIYQALGGK